MTFALPVLSSMRSAQPSTRRHPAGLEFVSMEDMRLALRRSGHLHDQRYMDSGPLEIRDADAVSPRGKLQLASLLDERVNSVVLDHSLLSM